MGILKTILIICLFVHVANGQVSDTTVWNVSFYKGDTIVKVIETNVVFNKEVGIHYKDNTGKYIFKEKDYFLSRERLNNKIVKQYYKP